MLTYYKPSLTELITQVQHIHSEPEGHANECLQVQETLIRKITYIERQIRKTRVTIKELKRTLGSQLPVRLNKEQSLVIKKRIADFHSRIDEYQDLLVIFRLIGDALAFSYISPWDIKPFVFKEHAGALSRKKGARLERRILRRIFAEGYVAILNDLTNCLRYGDVTAIKGERFLILEAKSSRNLTDRTERQVGELNNLLTYILTDRTDRLYGREGAFLRTSLPSAPIYHHDELNLVIDKALTAGIGYLEVESGLHYLALTKFDPQIIDDIYANRKGQILIDSVDVFNSTTSAYYPLTLSIRNPKALFKLYQGQLSINVIVDLGVVSERLKSSGQIPEWAVDDDEWVLGISSEHPISEDFEPTKISRHFFGRIFAEFLSLEWLVAETVNLKAKAMAGAFDTGEPQKRM
jgi:Holliday junction resolvase